MPCSLQLLRSNCIVDVVKTVNDNGAWDIFGWAKPGVVLDQATAPDQGTNPFQPGPMQ